MINNDSITIWLIQIMYPILGHERVYLPLSRVADTPLHIQEDEITTDNTIFWKVFETKTWGTKPKTQNKLLSTNIAVGNITRIIFNKIVFNLFTI